MMDLFISWSGERSGEAAQALAKWLRRIIQQVHPWISKDIRSGARWATEIATKLQSTKFGILCVTNDNVKESWLMFEAGALAKTLADTFVCPYLVDEDMKMIDLVDLFLSFRLEGRRITIHYG